MVEIRINKDECMQDNCLWKREQLAKENAETEAQQQLQQVNEKFQDLENDEGKAMDQGGMVGKHKA